MGFFTRSKLWIWNIKTNQLKSIKLKIPSVRLGEVKDIYYFAPYWIAESHASLIFIDLDKGTRRIIKHPNVNQGYSLGIDRQVDKLYWAHTDGSLRINLDTLLVDTYAPALSEDPKASAMIGAKLYFARDNLIFERSKGETKLIFHSPHMVKNIQSDKNFLMLMTKNSIIQLSQKGEIVKTLNLDQNTKLSNFIIKKSSFHCFLFEKDTLKSINLTTKTETIFRLPAKFKLTDYDCRGDFAILSSKSNIVILANYKKTNYSVVKSSRKKF